MIGGVILLLVLLLPVLLVVAGVASSNGSPETRRLVGGIMLAVGLLIMTGSGLCSLAMLFSGGGVSDAWFLVLLVGGLPFGGGVGLLLWARYLIRSARATSDNDLRDRFG